MMKKFELVKEVTGPLKTNCYLLYENKSKQAALFDVGGKIPNLNEIINKKSLEVKYLFCTHLHFDHVSGIKKARENFPEAKVAYHRKEIEVMNNMGFFGRIFQFKPESVGKQDIELEDDQSYFLGDLEIKTILSPGHTPGSICFLFEDYLISGDVLFFRGIGRTDLFGGNYDTLINSIKNLFKLPDNTKIFPGHGEETKIGFEKRENPFLNISTI